VEEDTVLRAYVLSATRNEHDAKDLLQNVWRILWEKRGQYDESRPFRAWAFGVARLEVLKWRQGRGRTRELLSDSVLELLADTAERQSEDLDLRGEFLERCLGKLKGFAKEVLTLRYGEGLRNAETASRLGRSVAAIEMTLVRARRALRECIQREMSREIPFA
jgi:RNA polymerase sigma-70 factor (ECF subfamily)